MSYVDGYVLAIPKKHLKAYRRMAALGKKAWMKHGAVDYKECVGDDLAAKWGTPFTRVMKLKPGETAVFAYIVFKSRTHRDRVNAKVMKEMAAMGGPPEGHALRPEAHGVWRLQDDRRVNTQNQQPLVDDSALYEIDSNRHASCGPTEPLYAVSASNSENGSI